MGIKGINSIKSMLLSLKNHHLDFEINWDSHQNKKFYWMANSLKIENALNFLNELNIEKPSVCKITGIVQNLDRTGKIILIDEAKKIYKIRLDKTNISEIEKLRINQFVTLKVIKYISSHPTFEKITENYEFIEII